MISDRELDEQLAAADLVDSADLPELPLRAWTTVTGPDPTHIAASGVDEPASVIAARQLVGEARTMPRRRAGLKHRRRRPLVLAGAGIAAAVTVVVLGLYPGSNPPDAFAGWTAVPDEVTVQQAVDAEAECVSQLGGATAADPQLPSTALANPTAVLVDRRGDWTYTVLASAPDAAGQQYVADCLLLSRPSQLGGFRFGGDPIPPAPAQGLVAILSGTLTGSSDGETASTYAGRSAPDVAAVTLVLPDGNNAQALVHDGWWSIWLPGDTSVFAPADIVFRTTLMDGTQQEATLDTVW